MIVAGVDGSVSLRHSGNEKFKTTGYGVTVVGSMQVSGITTFFNATTIVNGGYHRGIINSGAQEKIIGGYISGSDTLRLGESMYLTTTGLGIGESSPEEELHITASTPVIRLEDSDTSRQSQIVGVDGNLRFDADNGNAQADTNISFRTDGTERLRIASTGELGLGLTQDPPTGSFTMRLTETPEFNLYSTQHAQNNNCKINFGIGQSASVDGNTGARIEMNIPNAGGQMTGELKFHTNQGDSLQERLRITSAGVIKCGTSGVLKAEINNAVSGHQFISQCDDNNTGFEVYGQHGSTATRYTFACYDNRSGSKGRSFGVRGDGKTIFYGDALPSADTTYDLGSDSYTWDKFYYKNAYPEQSTEYRITSGTYSNGSWHDTAFGRDSMGGLDLNGVYIVTAFADLYQAMGGNYQCNYTWIVGIRNQYSNQTLVNTCPLLSVTGHSTNNFGASGATVGDGIRLGTSRTPASSGGEEQIVWRPAASTSEINNSAGRTLVFRCQRIGRSSLG